MPFYKKENDELLVGHHIDGPAFSLNAESRTEYKYPVQGWYWFDTLDEAMTSMSSLSSSPNVLTRLAFRNRFTMEEKVAIEIAKETDPMIRVFLDDLMAAEEIDLTNHDLITGVNYLEQLGLIVAGRAAEILI